MTARQEDIVMSMILLSAILIPLMFIVLFEAGCKVEDLDNGRMTLADGTEMRPYLTPWYLTHDDTVDESMVLDAMDWWNSQAGIEVFEVEAWSFSEVSVSAGYAGASADGVFNDITHDDGLIQGGDIIISSDIMYDEDYAFHVLLHEMGHALGLADDPHSLDLNSIMSSPILIGGQLTDGDRVILSTYD